KIMDDKIMDDLTGIARKLGEYVENGWAWRSSKLGRTPLVTVNPDASKMKLLRKIDNCTAQFLAVDCSTRTVRRANNWGGLPFPCGVRLCER
ncbi:MAG: hypothetical protein U9O89_02250, partial [Thermoproteota archaeon]|nr:hypothetical protein [Thermoproteota archaeon]